MVQTTPKSPRIGQDCKACISAVIGRSEGKRNVKIIEIVKPRYAGVVTCLITDSALNSIHQKAMYCTVVALSCLVELIAVAPALAIAPARARPVRGAVGARRS